MTSRPQSSPSIDHPPPPQGDDEDEERPTHTSEIGTLKKLPNHGTAWLGSSSGVYFVNTVRRAFSAAFAANQAVPASEDILTGEDAEGRSYHGPIVEGPSTTDTFPTLLSSSLGRLPEKKIAIELVMSFFKAWHPIFPMLHGPSFLKDMEILYLSQRPTPPAFSGSRQNKTSDSPVPVDVRKMVTFQLIINIASLDRADIQLPSESRIRSTADVTRVAGSLALDHDIATLQTLLAAQLYLVATLAIRAASTVGGMIVKLIYHAGLHRCPLRYAQLSEADCDIRKRIFWSAYALDRHCSLSLGDPNTIQDDDIDVCLSGRELHKAVARELLTHPEQEINLHRPDPSQRVGGLATGPVQDDPRVSAETSPETREKSLREAALISYVHWSKLTGRIIEIFHKSINHRFPKHEQIVYLTSDIETWWNNLPSFLTGDDSQNHSSDAPSPDGSTPQLSHLSSFFKIAYHRLLLLLSRPRLSLDQSTPEFQHGLQVCIRASRNILAGLRAHKTAGQSMFLPGLLSAAWMSGLIIAFACQLGKYPKARACADIMACLSLLESMNTRWYTVKNCHKVLSLLLANIQSRRASTSGVLAVAKTEQPQTAAPDERDRERDNRAPKRQRTNTRGEPTSNNSNLTVEDFTQSPRAGSIGGTPQSNMSSPPAGTMPPPTGNAPGSKLKHTPSSWSDTSFDNPSSSYDLSNFLNSHITTANTASGTSLNPNPKQRQSSAERQGHQSSSGSAPRPAFNPMGSALYSTAQEMAFAQSNMALPELPDAGSNVEDPMFWANMDFNMADVFGSAAWESMTGMGPFGTNAAGWDQTHGQQTAFGS